MKKKTNKKIIESTTVYQIYILVFYDLAYRNIILLNNLLD